jgi:hypothetical protein
VSSLASQPLFRISTYDFVENLVVMMEYMHGWGRQTLDVPVRRVRRGGSAGGKKERPTLGHHRPWLPRLGQE